MRVPPPAFENALRPSSALRALSAARQAAAPGRSPPAARARLCKAGLDRLRVPAGHGLLRGDADRSRPGRPAPQSRDPALAHPLPVPSGVRAVIGQLRIGRSVIREQPAAGGDRHRDRVRLEKSCDENRCLAAGCIDRAPDRAGTQPPDRGWRCLRCRRSPSRRSAGPAPA